MMQEPTKIPNRDCENIHTLPLVRFLILLNVVAVGGWSTRPSIFYLRFRKMLNYPTNKHFRSISKLIQFRFLIKNYRTKKLYEWILQLTWVIRGRVWSAEIQ